MLSKNEKIILEITMGIPMRHISLLAIVLLSGICYAIAVFYRFVPALLSFSDGISNFDVFLKMIRDGCFLPLILYFSMLVAVLVGDIVVHYKRAKLLKKLQVDMYLKKDSKEPGQS